MKEFGLKWLLPVLAILLLLCCACKESRGKGPTGPETELSVPLDSLFGSIFSERNAPGAVVIVMKGDSIYYNRSFGMARLGNDALPMSDSAVLNVASASKTFTTMGLLKLVDEGRLTLDDNLAKFFPEFKAPFFKRITLRHVLSHTSGLPDARPRTADQWKEYLKQHNSVFAQAPDFLRYGREDELARFFTTVDSLRFEPGTHYEYADAPYLLIPQIIEQLTGRKFEEWIETTVFSPAGLTETSYLDHLRRHTAMAHGYAPASGEKRQDVFRSYDGKWDEFDYGEAEFFNTRADNGIFTTPRDFVKWIRALYSGRVIAPALLDSANQCLTSTNYDNIGYGLGLYVQDTPELPKKVFHSTSNGGFGIFETIYPELDVFYLIFANRPDWNRLETSMKVDSILAAHKWL